MVRAQVESQSPDGDPVVRLKRGCVDRVGRLCKTCGKTDLAKELSSRWESSMSLWTR